MRRSGLPLACLVLAACGGDGGGSSTAGDACAEAVSKFRQCGLLSNPSGYFSCTEPKTDEERCAADCVLHASCSELKSSLCRSGSAAPQTSDASAVGTCEKACRAKNKYVCQDGSNPIDGARPCDGVADCNDGADEKACPMFACKTGNESVSEDARCDGSEDCQDGSDEAGCPSFRCKNGEEISEDRRCDDSQDCADGSDEVGCAQLSCA